MKEYSTDEIVVEWEPRLCYRSHNCVRSLPQVFDETGRPWIKVDAATADEVGGRGGTLSVRGSSEAAPRGAGGAAAV